MVPDLTRRHQPAWTTTRGVTMTAIMGRHLHRNGPSATRTWWALAGALVACTTPKSPTDWPGSTRELVEPEPNLSAPNAAVGNNEQNRVPTATSEQVLDPNVLASLVPAADQPQESQGHQPPDYLIQVLVSPGALQAYRAWGPASKMPVGTWVVARHSHRAGTGGVARDAATAPLYAMWRSPDRWHFAATTNKGLKIPSIEGACQDCHTQASSDQIFGPVRRENGPGRSQDPSEHAAQD